MKGFIAAAVPLLAAVASASPFSIETIHKDAAPLISSSNAKEIPDSYIIVFKKHVTDNHASAHHMWVQDIHDNHQSEKMELRKRGLFGTQDTIFEGLKHTYNVAGSLLGYSGHFDDAVIESIRRHPDVSSPERLTAEFERS